MQAPNVNLISDLVCREYGTKVTRCDILQENVNDTYRVHTQSGQYIFRLYDEDRREPHVSYEARLLHHVGDLASTPVVRPKGGDIVRVPLITGDRLGVLFTYLRGSLLSARTQTPKTATMYGRAVADLHDRMDGFSSTDERLLDEQILMNEPLTAVGRYLGPESEHMAFIRLVADNIIDELRKFRGDLSKGVCHGDLQGGNAMLADDGTIRFFDFERCGLGWRAYDVATFRWGAAMGKCRLGWSDATVQGLWTAYVDGYKRVRPLSGAELAATSALVALRHIWYLGLEARHALRWDRQALNDAFWRREVELLRDWDSN